MRRDAAIAGTGVAQLPRSIAWDRVAKGTRVDWGSDGRDIDFAAMLPRGPHLRHPGAHRSRSSGMTVPSNPPEVFRIMEWIPIVLVTFKLLVFGTGMFFAIKWHYDKEKNNRKK